MKTIIAVVNRKKGKSNLAVMNALNSLRSENSKLVLASSSVLLESDNMPKLEETDVNSPAVVGASYSNFLQERPQFFLFENILLTFNGHLYSPVQETSLLNWFNLSSHNKYENKIENLLKYSEGDFSLMLLEPGRMFAARDSIGVEPLYYGINDDFAALATNRTVLWKIGINDIFSFPPGCIASVDSAGFNFKPLKEVVQPKPISITMDEAARTLQGLLENSVQARIQGLKEIAVAFSGGLDSSVVAFLAKKHGLNVHLIHVSLLNQAETEDAKKIADDLNLPLSIYLFEYKEVERIVADIVEIIEDPDPVKLAIGIPFYWVAKKATESNFSVILAGQGADELFGGYQRYVKEYLSHGKRKVLKTMFIDVARLHETNLERDKKICNFHGVELRLPFASIQLVEFALSLPLELKIEKKINGLRKLVLRQVALNLGLPELVVNKPKKAIQYATGVNSVLCKIAKKQDLTIKMYAEKLFKGLKGS